MRSILTWVVAIGGLAYLATGVTSVRPGEMIVVRRFGKVVATSGPGLWIGWPWGIDRVDRVEVDRVQRIVVGTGDSLTDEFSPPLLTGDQNLVRMQVAMEYTVRPEESARFVMESDRVPLILARVAEAALAEWTAGQQVDASLLAGKSVLGPWLAGRVRDRIEPCRLGIEVGSVAVAELGPPTEVIGAFDAVTRSQAGMRTLEQESTQKANAMRLQVEARKFELEQQASAKTHAAKVQASADAEAFDLRRKQYRSAGPNALATLWWSELGPILGRMQAAGRVQILDERLGVDALDILQTLPPPKR